MEKPLAAERGRMEGWRDKMEQRQRKERWRRRRRRTKLRAQAADSR